MKHRKLIQLRNALIKLFPIVYIVSFVVNWRGFGFGANTSHYEITVILSAATSVSAILISELQIRIQNQERELTEFLLSFWAFTAAIFLFCWLEAGNLAIAFAFLICPFWGILYLPGGQIKNAIFLLVCIIEVLRLALSRNRNKIVQNKK